MQFGVSYKEIIYHNIYLLFIQYDIVRIYAKGKNKILHHPFAIP